MFSVGDRIKKNVFGNQQKKLDFKYLTDLGSVTKLLMVRI